MRCEAGAAAPAAPAPPAVGGVNPPVPEAIQAPTDVPADVDAAAQDDEEEHMLAEAARSDPAAPRRDPEEVALELLQSELGARRIDGG